MSRVIIASAFCLVDLRGVIGGADTDHSKHNDWWYGADEGGTTPGCNVVDDAYRCGPTSWSTVTGDTACAEVGTQSPINLANAVTNANLSALALTPGTYTTVNFEWNSHTTEVTFATGSTRDKLVWNGVDFFLDQFHFHAPSENQIDGKYYPMEVHHVHHNAAGQALVLSVMIDSTATTANTYYQTVWAGVDAIPAGASTTDVFWVLEAQTLAPSPYTSVLPANKDYYNYMGSFTTPPCTTNTIWITLKNTISITTAQLEAYRLKIQNSPNSQLAVCDTARCGGTTPTGVADQMASGSTWSASQGTNNRPIQSLTGANDAGRMVYHFAAPTPAPAATGTTSMAVRMGARGIMCAFAFLVASVSY